MPDFARLDRLDAMQRQPMGSIATSMKQPSPVASQYKRQAAMYGQALRTLSRAARRGGNGRGEKGQRQAAMAAEAGMKAIELRDKANANGFSPGGIQRYGDVQGNIASRERDYTEGAQDLESKMRLERDYGNSVLSRGTPPMRPDAETMEARHTLLMRPDAKTMEARHTPLMRPDAKTMEARHTSTRISAALDMLEGSNSLAQGGIGQLNRGREAARSLGVDDPDSILSGDRNLKYRQTLDMALGKATSPEEIAALKERGTKFGISPKAFDRRAKWWDSNR